MKIYLSCSLTHSPDDYKQFILNLKQRLKEKHEILEFFGLVGGTPEDVYKHDVECVKTCDIILAECSLPAMGIGFEIALGLQLGKKILAVAKTETKVSRIILGITDPHFHFQRYESVDDILKLI